MVVGVKSLTEFKLPQVSISRSEWLKNTPGAYRLMSCFKERLVWGQVLENWLRLKNKRPKPESIKFNILKMIEV